MAEAAEHPEKQALQEAVLGSDPLLGVLEQIAAHHSLPFSENVAKIGIAPSGPHLTLSELEAAARNLKLNARIYERAPSDVPGIVCPYLVFFKNGDVGIVEERTDRRKFKVSVAGAPAQLMKSRQLDRECEGFVAYLTPIDSEQKPHWESVENHNKWFWPVVRRFWPSWTQVMVAALLVNILGLALPLFVMNVYDRVIPYEAFPTLWALAIGVAIALVFDFFLRLTRSLILDSSTHRIDMRVSSDMYRHALDIKMDKRPPRAGDIATQLREFEGVRDFFTSAGVTAAIDLLFIGVFLSALWWIVGPLALVPLISVPIVLIVTLLIQIPLSRSIASALSASGNRHSVLIESLVGIEAIKSIAAEGFFQRRWDAAVSSSVRANSSTRFWSSFAMYFTMTVQQAVSLVLIVWGVYLVADGTISIGALIASNILAGRVLAPLGGVAMTLSRFQQSIQSLKGLNSLMRLEGDHASTRSLTREVEKATLRLDDVTFQYPMQLNPSLEDVSLAFSPGERIGLIGRVGSGKSTLGKLISGLYPFETGQVVLEDADIRSRSVADVRDAICYVGQDPDLFSGTVRENILLGRVVSSEDLERALLISGVSSWVQGHPLGLDMPVGERGSAISGGQRQAVVLARAMLSRPKILFLDEPTAAMDNATENAFISAFAQLADPSTTLIIATHRLSLLRLVNRVIVMEKGKIVEDGSRQAILSKLNKSGLTEAGKGQTAAKASVGKGGKSNGK